MKKFLLLLTFALPMLFSSCSKDEDGDNGVTSGSSLVGTWFAPEDSNFADLFGVVMVIQSDGIWKSYEEYEDYEDDYYIYGKWSYSAPNLVCKPLGYGIGDNMYEDNEGEFVTSATFKINSLTSSSVSGEIYIAGENLGNFTLYKKNNGDSGNGGNSGSTGSSIDTSALSNLWMCVQYTPLTGDPATQKPVILNGSASGPNYNYIRFAVSTGNVLKATYYNRPEADAATEYYFTLEGNKIFDEGDLVGTILLCKNVKNETGLQIVWEPDTYPFNPSTQYQRDAQYWLDTWSTFE